MTATLVDPQLIARLSEQGDTPLPMFELAPGGKTCKQCSLPMVRRATERESRWKARECCSRSCAGRLKEARKRGEVPGKTCPICGDTFTRPLGRASSEFASRQFCSPKCAVAARPASQPLSKVCEHCSVVFYGRPGKKRREVLKRRFCSAECHRAWRRVHAETRQGVETRSCEQCGGEFARRVGDESLGRFAVRRFCSSPCALEHRNEHRVVTVPTVFESKPCEQCRQDMPHDPRRERRARWVGRRFCSRICVDASRRKAPVVKPPRPQRTARANASPPMSIPAAPPREPAPVWRPAGWSAAPAVHVVAVSDVAS